MLLAALVAGLVATSQDGSTVTLTDDVGQCLKGARVAVWRSADASETIPGCWVLKPEHGVILVAFLDGDRATIPVQAMRRPTSL